MTFSGAENGTRTRDLNLGKVALYQLSYFRVGTANIATNFGSANFSSEYIHFMHPRQNCDAKKPPRKFRGGISIRKADHYSAGS